MDARSKQRRWRWAERCAWVVGIALLAVWGAAYVHREVLSRRDVARFVEARKEFAAARPSVKPDTTLWSPQRIAAYEETLDRETSLPLGLLRIPRIGLEVPLLEGVDEWTLNRAVGRVPGTGIPNGPGNLAIAGHRDGFFRGLKDIDLGDTIELATLEATETYRIAEMSIVDPDDVSVLDPTPEPSITLVTCYPFYFVGHAPQRFIVRAVRRSATDTAGAS